jgi:hypothetical protein
MSSRITWADYTILVVDDIHEFIEELRPLHHPLPIARITHGTRSPRLSLQSVAMGRSQHDQLAARRACRHGNSA